LDGLKRLDAPLTLANLNGAKDTLITLVGGMKANHPGKPLYFPFELSKRAVRPLQGYAFKLPRLFVARFDELAGCLSASSGLGQGLLPAETLYLATPEFIWAAVQQLLEDPGSHRFGPSTDYDLVADDGRRLAPKAVFGVALSMALGGATIEPGHFKGGEGTTAFRLLRAAGYQVVQKGAAVEEGEDLPNLDGRSWSEGGRRLVSHLKRERGTGLSPAKRAQFRRVHGRLFCERCGLDPVDDYKTPHAEACIEVHHAATYVSEMAAKHKTTLDDLQCLCANCHRLVHRMALELSAESESQPVSPESWPTS
jgi:hypothetical protein